MAKVKQICEEKLRPIIEEMGFELVDVSYVKENGGMSLIFTVDKEDGVGIDDCEVVSKKLDPILDELNPTDDAPYTLVVSSPGLDRPLKSDRDFKRNLGKKVEVNLFAKVDGRKTFVGQLKSFDDKTIQIDEDGKACTFNRDKIASVKLVIEF